MRTAVIVAGALREMELCSKTWKFPFHADWHLITWSTTSFDRSGVFEPADLSAVHKSAVKFLSSHVYDRETSGIEMMFSGNPKAVTWFWKTAYELFGNSYDRFVFIRPDLFLWSKAPFPANYDPRVSGAAFHGTREPAWAHDQFFVVSADQLRILADVYNVIRVKDTAYGENDVHNHLGELIEDGRIEFNFTDLEAFHSFVARPNSRHLSNEAITYELAREVNLLTARWWNENVGSPSYEGLLLP